MKTTKVNTNNDCEFRSKLEKIINRNCKEIPYEGTEVDKQGILEDVINLLNSPEYSLLKHTKSKL
jgi:hypothetical protein